MILLRRDYISFRALSMIKMAPFGKSLLFEPRCEKTGLRGF